MRITGRPYRFCADDAGSFGGKPAHPQCVGQSKAKLVRGETAAAESIFIEWAPGRERINEDTKLANNEQINQALHESTRAIVFPDGWKLCLRDKDKNELYNLNADPGEQNNLYYADSHRDIISKLTNDIHRWQERVGDTLKV